MLPATLLAGLRIHFFQRGPKPHCAVPDGKFGRVHATAFEVQQNLCNKEVVLSGILKFSPAIVHDWDYRLASINDTIRLEVNDPSVTSGDEI